MDSATLSHNSRCEPTVWSPPLAACTATKHRTGEPCRMAAIVGGTVCPAHGGRAPQVRAAALARLEAAVPSTLDKLISLRDQASDLAVSLRASVDIMDRAGYRPADQLKLSGDAEAPLEIIISRPVRPTPTDEAS